MQTIVPYLAILIVILTGYGVYKKYQINIVLLFAGLSLNLLAVLGGFDHILPKNAPSTGFIGFDIVELLRAVSRQSIFTTGFVILVAGGFAAYMDQMGASGKLVQICLRPLKKLGKPYLVLGAVFILGHFLGLVVTSAAGLAMLLVESVYPMLIGLGVSGVAAAAVIGSVLIASYAPSSAIAVLSAKTEEKLARTPAFYALLPLVPLVLLFVFNKIVCKTIVLDVATAMFMGWIFALIVDWIYRRNTTAVFQDGAAMFRGMGHMLTSVVGLIFVAALFAAGLQNTGLVGLMVDAAKHAGLGLGGTGLIMSGVIGLVTVLTGSGVASFTSLVPLAPTIADSFGGSAVELAMMMQISSECLRPVSPVAGVVIIVAGFAGVSPLAIVRRTLIPCLVALVVSTAVTYAMM